MEDVDGKELIELFPFQKKIMDMRPSAAEEMWRWLFGISKLNDVSTLTQGDKAMQDGTIAQTLEVLEERLHRTNRDLENATAEIRARDIIIRERDAIIEQLRKELQTIQFYNTDNPTQFDMLKERIITTNGQLRELIQLETEAISKRIGDIAARVGSLETFHNRY